MAALQGVSPYNARQYQQNQRRGLNSPGAVGPGGNPAAQAALQRQNSFQGQGGGGATTPDGSGVGFGGPQSPYGTNVNVFQQQQLQRLQRQGSVPQATQHLPGKEWNGEQCWINNH